VKVKKTVKIAFTYTLEASSESIMDDLIKRMLETPTYGLGGGDGRDFYKASLKKTKGQLIDTTA